MDIYIFIYIYIYIFKSTNYKTESKHGTTNNIVGQIRNKTQNSCKI